MLRAFDPFSTTGATDRIRVERIEKDLDYTYASSFVENFYVKRARQNGGVDGDVASAVTEFPKGVILALAYAIRYLEGMTLFPSHLLHRFADHFPSASHRVQAVVLASTHAHVVQAVQQRVAHASQRQHAQQPRGVPQLGRWRAEGESALAAGSLLYESR